MAFFVTCEHGGNRVPRRYRRLFEGRKRALESHRAHDPGALDLARYLSRTLGCPLEFSTVTRLLVDLNRSAGHRAVFSELSRSVDPETREDVIRRYYHPYRERIENRMAELWANARTVVHVSSHSFTPVLEGRLRIADVAWLYDPTRFREKRLSCRWRDALSELRPDLRLRRNYPYRGSDDSFTTYLRGRFPPSRYLGVELEVNQRWFLGDRRDWIRLRRSVAAALTEATVSQISSKR